MWVLELNDSEIVLSRGTDVCYREPGVALLGESEVAFGHAALTEWRLHPRQAHNQYWQKLNAEPVVPSAPNVQNQADLVYLHLNEIKRSGPVADDDELVVVVPSAATAEQLSLLLGIAQEAPLPISAIVDLSVACASTRPLPEHCKFLDVSQHRASIATLNITDQVRRTDVTEVAETGLNPLLTGWIDAVADLFVRETRFDPLRIAETEQQLFNQVYAKVLDDAPRSEVSIEVSHQGQQRRIDVSPTLFAQKSAQRYDLLIRELGPATTIVVTHRVTRLPGLSARLEAAGHHLEWLTPGTSGEGVNRHALLGGDHEGVRFVTVLPSAGRVSESKARRVETPTHLLSDGQALPIGESLDATSHPQAIGLLDGFRVVRTAAGVQLQPAVGARLSLNGRPPENGAELAPGDTLVAGQIEFKLIRVIDA